MKFINKFKPTQTVLIVACIVLAVSLAGSSAYSNENGQVQGVVRNNTTGSRLDSVHVEIQGTEIACITDSLGRFVLTQVLPGEYKVIFHKEGYDTSVLVGVTIYSELTAEHNCSLNPCESSVGCGSSYIYSQESMIASLCFPPLGSYKGTVTDQFGMPIVGAEIDIIEADVVLISDSLGQYSISVYGNSYNLRCSATGFSTVVYGNVEVLNGLELIVDFRLHRE